MKRRNYTGENNPKWRGGKTVMKDGRVLIYAPEHPNANAIGGKYILEYRIIAEQQIGRLLRNDEIVHHINGDITDNRPENIEVMTQTEHARRHGKKSNNLRPQKGIQNGRAKLTEQHVLLIRQDKRNLEKIANEYDIGCSTVSRIRRNRAWRHV